MDGACASWPSVCVGHHFAGNRAGHIAAAAPLRQWFDAQVLPFFAPRILPASTESALCCALLNLPAPQPYRDGLIAAAAIVHGLTVVTRNEADFVGTGVVLLNPWRWDEP